MDFLFYFILINFNFKSRMWLVATMMESQAPEPQTQMASNMMLLVKSRWLHTQNAKPIF